MLSAAERSALLQSIAEACGAIGIYRSWWSRRHIDRIPSDSPSEGEANSLEEEVAEIWRDLLAVDRVTVQDNFFDLGGHSLLMVSVAAKVQERFELGLPLYELLDAPTPRLMAARIAEGILALRDSDEIERWLQEADVENVKD